MQFRNLILRRPLVALDTETTGLLPDGRAVEIGLVRLEPDGAESVFAARLNPGVPIPGAASRIHGITDDQVVGCPRWPAVYRELLEWIGDADLCGFNLLGFDLPIIQRECERWALDAGALFRGRSLVDPMAIFHFHEWGSEYPPRGQGTLRAAVRHYLGREHAGAHGAEADARAALAVLDAQVAAHDLPREIERLNQYPFTPAELFPAPPEPEPAKAVQGRLLETMPGLVGPYGPGVGRRRP